MTDATTPELLEFEYRTGANQNTPTSLPDARKAAGRTVSQNPSIGFCGSLAGLNAINDPGKELVIYQRPIPFCMANWLEEMEPSQLPDFRILVSPANVQEAVETQFDECGMPSGAKRKLFISDINNLVTLFAQITRGSLVDVRLDRIDHDACWKFHMDSVETRLLTTYRGPTTEWVNPRYAAQALREQTDYDGPLESLQQNDVAIFRGRRADLADGIVHRSPPIAGSGSMRLLLCLNTQSIVSPEPWRPKR